MTEKELRKLNRYQLLELLVSQTERGDRLQARVDELEKELSEQNLRIASLISVAETALEFKGIFDTAKASAQLYISDAQAQANEIREAAHQEAEKILAEAKDQE